MDGARCAPLARERKKEYLAMSSLLAVLKRFAFMLVPLLVCTAALAQTNAFQPNPSAGPTGVLVHSKFGGQIFGFDIDQNGSEGLLSEAKELSGGHLLAAVETFDQATGNNVAVVQFAQPIHGMDDFVTYGIVGNSVGLFEHEHVGQLFVVGRTYGTLNPLSTNRVNSAWTPPIDQQHIIMPTGVSRNQGVPNVAVFVYDNSGQFVPLVFSSNVANNTFGPVVRITDSNNFGSVPPALAYNSANNTALLGGGTGAFGRRPVFAVVDLTAGTFSEFIGTGFGFVNGLAIDAADGIACSTTEDDATVEFYDLHTQTGFGVILPGSGGQQFFSGADVEYDPINKVFLVAQPNSSTTGSGSTIYVYDIHGNLQETLNGFDFSNTFNVIPMHIALHPSQRIGYVDGPDAGVTELTQFTY
jgi:hypothetical protein